MFVKSRTFGDQSTSQTACFSPACSMVGEFGPRDRVRSCASGLLDRWKALNEISVHCVAWEPVARRSRDKLVIFLTLERPPRGRPLWLCRRHSSQCRDSSGAAPRPLSRPKFAHRPLSRPTFADRSLSRPACVAWVRMIPAYKRVGVVRLSWGLSGSSHRLVSDFVGPARRC